MHRLFIFLLVAPLACQESKDPVYVDPGYEFYPLNLGIQRTYLVQRIDYFLGIDSASNQVITMADTQQYFILEEIQSILQNLDGSQIFIEHSLSKSDTSMAWPLQPDSVYQVQNNNIYLNRNKNNRTTTELRFPLEKSASWDGNAFNNLSREVYVVDSFGFSVTLDTTEFKKCLRVIKSDIENLIERDIRKEIYAEGSGAILKDYSVVQYKQNLPPTTVGLQRIEKGYEEKWTWYELD